MSKIAKTAIVAFIISNMAIILMLFTGCFTKFGLSSEEIEPQYELRYENDGCVIVGVNYLKDNETTLDIPSSINGVNVIGIDKITRDITIEDAKVNLNSVMAVNIPQTVEKIGDYAFYGMGTLQSVAFKGISQLTEIGDYAFANCVALTAINISQNLRQIGEGAFKNCANFKAFNVDSSNSVFSSENGVLYSKDKSRLLSYPIGKTDLTYTVDSNCNEISDFAFAHNSYLQTLNMGNVRTIRQYGLYDCTKLSEINANNLDLIDVNALDETLWLQNQTTENIILGNVFVKYQGQSSSIDVSGVSSISPYAFYDNQYLEKVYIYGNEIINIGDYAFANCNNLNSVYICKTDYIVFVLDSAFIDNADNRAIYVPDTILDDYLNNAIWQKYSDDIQVHQTTVNYESNGGLACESNTVKYRGYLSFPTTTRSGYVFGGWYDNLEFSGQAMNEQTLWNKLDDNVTFYAKWNIREYLAIFHANGGTVTPSSIYFTINDDIELPIPTRNDSTFLGWYDNEDYSGSPVSRIFVGSYGDRHYYAKWESDICIVTLNYGYDGVSAGAQHVKYGKQAYLPIPHREEYDFIGWAYNGKLMTDEGGWLLEPWSITEPVELVAQWSLKTTT